MMRTESQTERVIVVYHKDCIDGTSAAAIALRKFPHAKLFPLSHAYKEAEIEEILSHADLHTVLYTVDCAIGVDRFLEQGLQVVTLDHHIGVRDELEQLRQKYSHFTLVFNNDQSGASLSWSYFFPEEEMSEIIALIEDADLWKWRYGDDTKYVNNYLSMFRNDPVTMLELIEGSLVDIKGQGKVISLYADKEIEAQLKIPQISLRVGPHTVIASNVTVYESAVGNQLAERFQSAVALFTIKGDQVRISFRSLDGQEPSALELATTLGGGGHVHASGASVPLEDFIEMIVFAK